MSAIGVWVGTGVRVGGEERLKVGEEGSVGLMSAWQLIDNCPVSAVQTLGRAACR